MCHIGFGRRCLDYSSGINLVKQGKGEELVSFKDNETDQRTGRLVKVCMVGDLAAESVTRFDVQGQRIAIFNVNKIFHAIDNACPHRGGELAHGGRDGNIVSCPLHQWKFDITTGVCVSPNNGSKVRTYPLIIENDAVLLEFPAERIVSDPEIEGLRYLVRFGSMGHLSWFHSRASVGYEIKERVVVRTHRGLESGEVLTSEREGAPTTADNSHAGELLRSMTEEDKLQERAAHEGEARAFDACQKLLAERNMPMELIDVEQLLDGENIIFHFLGDPPSEITDLTQQLAEQYDARIEFLQFMERAEAGCGPKCGTDEAQGCGTDGAAGGCGSCSEKGGCSIV